MRKNEKPFDCIEFKRKAQREIAKELEGKSRKEQIRYFEEAAENGPFAEWWKQAKKHTEEKRKEKQA